MRIVLAEDLALLREGLTRIFETYGLEVADAVSNGPSLIRALTTHRPDIAVVDVRLPPTFTDEGLRAAIDARQRFPGLPVLVLSQYVEPICARELLSDGAGAAGYLLKDRVMDIDRLIAAVRQVAAGGTVMDPDVIAALLTRHAADAPLQTLTPREHEVLVLMAEGRSNAAIASRMFITEKAVSKHSSNPAKTTAACSPSSPTSRAEPRRWPSQVWVSLTVAEHKGSLGKLGSDPVFCGRRSRGAATGDEPATLGPRARSARARQAVTKGAFRERKAAWCANWQNSLTGGSRSSTVRGARCSSRRGSPRLTTLSVITTGTPRRS